MPSKAKGYTLEDVGCYVDGARGIYMVDAIVELAEAHGMETPKDCTDDLCMRCQRKKRAEWVHCQSYPEVEEYCDDHMNTHHAVEGASWGRNDNGDWGLWPDNDDA